jgi:hypothetical protein
MSGPAGFADHGFVRGMPAGSVALLASTAAAVSFPAGAARPTTPSRCGSSRRTSRSRRTGRASSPCSTRSVRVRCRSRSAAGRAGQGQVIGVRGPFGTDWGVPARGRAGRPGRGRGSGLAPLRPALLAALAARGRYRRVIVDHDPPIRYARSTCRVRKCEGRPGSRPGSATSAARRAPRTVPSASSW